MMLSLCACGGGNTEYNPNRGKVLLTDELKAEIEEYLTVPHETFEDIKNAEWEFYRHCQVYASDFDVNFDSCEITSYEQEDDYNYIVYTVFRGKDNHGDNVELKTSLFLYFNEDTNEIVDDYKQFEKDLKKLQS